MLDQPLDLGCRLIGSQSEPLALKDEAIDHRAKVLPTQSGSERFAALGVKDNGRGPLVGDSHDVAASAVGQRSRREERHEVAYFAGVEFDLTRVGRRHGQWRLMLARDESRVVDDGRTH